MKKYLLFLSFLIISFWGKAQIKTEKVVDPIVSGTVVIEVSKAIEASNTINSTAVATYRSTSYVVLEPGFQAEEGSVFIAQINLPNPVATFPENKSTQPNQKDVFEADPSQWMNIYPNPNDGNFSIAVDMPDDNQATHQRVQIYYLNGDLVYDKEVKRHDVLTLRFTELKKGAYFVKLWEGDEIVDIKRLLFR